MATSAFLSMWISNTATAVMMVPIGLAMVLQIEEDLEYEEWGANFHATKLVGDAWSIGTRYTFNNERTKVGLEFNSGSKYWFNFALAEVRDAKGEADAAMAAAEPAPCVPVAATDPVYILYTSGTTGQPKGVVHTHIPIRNTLERAQIMGLTAHDVHMNYLPLFHIYAYSEISMMCVLTGACQVLMDVFDADRATKMAAEGKTVILVRRETSPEDLAGMVAAAGILTSILTLARLLGWVLENHPEPLWALFFGLILASAVLLLQQVPRWIAPRAAALAIGGGGIGIDGDPTQSYLFDAGTLFVTASPDGVVTVWEPDGTKHYAIRGVTAPSIAAVDPAVATGPFVTTAIDIISVFFYFIIATTLLGL